MLARENSKIMNTKPTGSFPPIFTCKKKNKNIDVNINIRGFTKNEEINVVSLKELISDREKEIKPFIEF